jgi:hypothetical protein
MKNTRGGWAGPDTNLYVTIMLDLRHHGSRTSLNAQVPILARPIWSEEKIDHSRESSCSLEHVTYLGEHAPARTPATTTPKLPKAQHGFDIAEQQND